MTDEIALFVYGLLLPGEKGFESLGLAAHARRLGPERIAGRLYHLGDYPGLVPGGRGIVHGELLMLREPALFATLDAYELYDPENPDKSEYLRMRVDLLDSGRSAWTYAYNRPVANRPVIAAGCWQTLRMRAARATA